MALSVRTLRDLDREPFDFVVIAEKTHRDRGCEREGLAEDWEVSDGNISPKDSHAGVKVGEKAIGEERGNEVQTLPAPHA